MFEMGFIVGLGLIVTLLKAPPKVKVTVLSHPVAMDVIIFVVLCALHWGTFSGVMVATIGALTCSVVLSLGRKVYGYIARDAKGRKLYHRGMVDLSAKLGKNTPIAAYV